MKKVSALSAYFSHSGNTRVIANQIHESFGGDIFEIVPVDPYPSDYDEVVEQAQKELSEEYRPRLKNEGSGLGRSVVDTTKLCPQSTVLDGLAARGRDVKNAQNEVSERLRKIGVVESNSAPRCKLRVFIKIRLFQV